MARVTVEDCIDKVESPYELVLVAKERATQLNAGIEPTIDRDNDKNTVISLREIAEEKIKVSDLTDSAVYKLRKHVEQVDDSAEDDEEIGDLDTVLETERPIQPASPISGMCCYNVQSKLTQKTLATEGGSSKTSKIMNKDIWHEHRSGYSRRR